MITLYARRDSNSRPSDSKSNKKASEFGDLRAKSQPAVSR